MLETERLLLRAVAITDVTNLQAIYGDPQVMRYASDPAFMHESAYVQTVASIHRYLLEDQGIEWGVVLKSSAVMVGVVGLHHFEGVQAEIGCLLAREYWGRGLMREAVLAMQGFAPGVGLARLHAEIDAGNVRSERLFAGLGFVQTGDVWIKHLSVPGC